MITVQDLTKRRGARAVVSDVMFCCEPGTVTGFLGPNGAGKTTTLRILVGLTAPDSAQALLFGKRYRDLPNPGRRVGVLLDASAQHAGRRGREALAVFAQTMGVPVRRVDELLELVGLDEAAARRRVGRYSLGMRQRLGFAHALLGDPEVAGSRLVKDPVIRRLPSGSNARAAVGVRDLQRHMRRAVSVMLAMRTVLRTSLSSRSLSACRSTTQRAPACCLRRCGAAMARARA
jgi:ABC-type transporter Mla maintaining outer membrane lipid asymmetry ATPase subunit MlaF